MSFARKGWFTVAAIAALASVLSPRAASAQEGSLEFADLAAGAFGIMCFFVDGPSDAELAARLLGLHPAPPDARIAERMLPGAPATAWSLGNSGRQIMLARHDAGTACRMDVFGVEPSTMEGTFNSRMALMRSQTMAVVAEEIPRPFPRPALRARYRLTASDGATTLVEMYVERQAGWPDRPVLVARPAPP